MRTARQDRFYDKRMQRARVLEKAADRKQLEQEIHLVKAPGALAAEKEKKLRGEGCSGVLGGTEKPCAATQTCCAAAVWGSGAGACCVCVLRGGCKGRRSCKADRDRRLAGCSGAATLQGVAGWLKQRAVLHGEGWLPQCLMCRAPRFLPPAVAVEEEQFEEGMQE